MRVHPATSAIEGRTHRSRILAFIATIMGLAVALVVPASGAQAATGQSVAVETSAPVSCYGDYCSGKDPKDTHCDQDAVTVDVQDLSAGRLELRWSPTCKTNWARYDQYPTGWTFSDSVYELRAVQDTGYTQSLSFPDQTAPEGVHWTPMIYSPEKKVKAVALVNCGDETPMKAIMDCALNGQVETRAF